MKLLPGGGMLGLGFLLGTAGLKALKSNTAKNLYVKGIAGAIKLKDSAEELVEQAKENVDDMVAEAEALNKKEAAEAEAEQVAAEAETVVLTPQANN